MNSEKYDLSPDMSPGGDQRRYAAIERAEAKGNRGRTFEHDREKDNAAIAGRPHLVSHPRAPRAPRVPMTDEEIWHAATAQLAPGRAEQQRRMEAELDEAAS
jgi:hypothetical protein